MPLRLTGTQDPDSVFPDALIAYDLSGNSSGEQMNRAMKVRVSGTEVQHTAMIARLCRVIEQAEQSPSLADLAEMAGFSAHYFHRVFKAATGVTPKAYATAHRAEKVRNALGRKSPVTDAIYSAGFNASSRFYEKSNQLLGMTPGNYRSGGINTVIRFAVGRCSLGAILVAASDKGICAILMGDDPEALVRDLQDRFARARLVGGDVNFENWVAQVVGFVEAPRLGLNLPLDIHGTTFQLRVWQALQKIPAGSTATYTEIARKIGAPKAVRAVASACAANALVVAIPCHRVVRRDGSLSGYRWGIARKRTLIVREANGK